jgi:hypothetical protein
MRVQWEPKIGPAAIVGVLSIVATLLSVGVLWGNVTSRQDTTLDAIKAVITTQEKFWNIVGTMDKNVGDIKTSQATMVANFNSHTREDDAFENTVKAAIQDHENRLRMISQPPVRP